MITVECAHCSNQCTGKITLSVHLGSQRINQLASPWSFCNESCREQWFNAATSDDLFAVDRHPREHYKALWNKLAMLRDLAPIAIDVALASYGDSITAASWAPMVGIGSLECELGKRAGDDLPLNVIGRILNILLGIVRIEYPRSVPAQVRYRRGNIVPVLVEQSPPSEQEQRVLDAIDEYTNATSAHLHDEDGATVATVLHHDGGDAVLRIDTECSPGTTILAGTPVLQHGFEHPRHINLWWRGEMAAVPLNLPTYEDEALQ